MFIIWHISRENNKMMTGLFFREGNGIVIYMRLPRRRRALRVSAAETLLAVYHRRLISDLDVTFQFYSSVFFGMANLFWL